MRNLSRRKFLKALGWSAGGIVVVGLPGRAAAFPTFPHFAAPTEEDAAVWLSLRPGGTIELYSPRAEIGQGITTGLRQIVAEELSLDLELVRCISLDTGRIRPAKATVGSESIEVFGPLLAQAAAALSMTVRSRAATRLGVAEETLIPMGNGFRGPTGAAVTLSRLAEGDALIIDDDAVEAAEPAARPEAHRHR